MPPFYEPVIVADAILYAAEHPVRHLFVGDAARIVAMGQALSPQVMDRLLLGVGFKGQRTQRPLPENSPDNLFAPLNTYNQVHGDFGDQSMAVSPYNTLIQSLSGIQVVAAGLAIGMAAALLKKANRADTNGYRGKLSYRREPIEQGRDYTSRYY